MCAEACLHHRWLRRKAPPPPPKPATPAPAPTPTPVVTPPEDKPEVNNNSPAEEDKNEAVVAKDADEAGKLAGAKDNLRTIVERWTEHPDSPYIFDTTAHTISPCPSLASVLTEPGDVLVAGAVHNGEVAEDVVGGGGLLDPEGLEGRQLLHPVNGLLHVPVLVGVHHLQTGVRRLSFGPSVPPGPRRSKSAPHGKNNF